MAPVARRRGRGRLEGVELSEDEGGEGKEVFFKCVYLLNFCA